MQREGAVPVRSVLRRQRLTTRHCTLPAHAELPDVRTGTPVLGVRSLGPQGPVQLTAADGEAQYDAVLLATHTDISLRILGKQGPKVRVCGELASHRRTGAVPGLPFCPAL